MASSLLVSELQQNPDCIRNVCILAHVDHGKTTLSDYLVSTNGAISGKMAGKLRYLDSRQDEQERQITMKSSSISLVYQNNLINLIDSPGHIDFSSEVSSAVRLCDGALVLVDVIEGIRVQTQSVLRQAWAEGVKPCLVINKVDRLVTELHLSPMEAYMHIRALLERINALTSTFLTADSMREAHGHHQADASIHLDQDESKQLLFSPAAGNVVFSSALDGWGFGIAECAEFYSNKLGMNKAALERVLWGEYYYLPKSRTVSRKPKGRVVEPMFVQFVLRHLWQAYQCLCLAPDPQKMDRLVSYLSLKLPRRELHSKDARVRVSSVLSRWYPISDAVLRMIVQKLPSPPEAIADRLPLIWPDASPPPLVDAVAHCRAGADVPLLVYVSQMLALSPEQLDMRVRKKFLRQAYVRNKFQASASPSPDAVLSDLAALDVNADDVVKEECKSSVEQPSEAAREPPAKDADADADAENDDEKDRVHFMAVARVFSGTLRSTSALYVHGSTVREPNSNAAPAAAAAADNDNDNDDEDALVPTFVDGGALRLFNMKGRDMEPLSEACAGHVVGILGLENAVLSSATLSSLPPGSVTPFRPLVFQSSPIMRVAIQPRRAQHLPQLSHGLRLLSLADPNVIVRHERSGEQLLCVAGELHLERCLRDLSDRFARGIPVVVSPPLISFRECITRPCERAFESSSKRCRVGVRVAPLTAAAARVLDANTLTTPGPALVDAWRDAGEDARTLRDCRSFGPRRRGPNMLSIDEDVVVDGGGGGDGVENALVNGFQLACVAGPLCDEELFGVHVVVESVYAGADAAAAELMLSVKEAIAVALKEAAPRLVEAVYAVQLQCTAAQLGNLCGVIARRRGRTVRDEMIEGTDLFAVEAELPVAECLGLTRELHSKTSGSATPQLVFSHWQTIEQDPYWTPTTEQEIEEYGVEASAAPNMARKLVDDVRRRKGLFVQEHVVEHAEKQRTLKK